MELGKHLKTSQTELSFCIKVEAIEVKGLTLQSLGSNLEVVGLEPASLWFQAQ